MKRTMTITMRVGLVTREQAVQILAACEAIGQAIADTTDAGASMHVALSDSDAAPSSEKPSERAPVSRSAN